MRGLSSSAACATLVLSILAAAVAAPAAAQESTVQPGVRLVAGDASCTLAFVIASAESLYISTAGHCIEDGQDAEADGVGIIGRAAFRIDEGEGRDFALIRLLPEHWARVEPEVLHWGGPTGVFRTPGEHMDEVRFFGHGVVFGETEATQPRTGIGPSWEGAGDFYFKGAGVPGDSGSPVLHESGQAIGVLNTVRAAVDANTNGGTHIDAGLALAAEAGIAGKLVLAGEDPVAVMRSMGAAPTPPPEKAPGTEPPAEPPKQPAQNGSGVNKTAQPVPEPEKSPSRDVPFPGVAVLAAGLVAAAAIRARRT